MFRPFPGPFYVMSGDTVHRSLSEDPFCRLSGYGTIWEILAGHVAEEGGGDAEGGRARAVETGLTSSILE
jgi:hypothetical protein